MTETTGAPLSPRRKLRLVWAAVRTNTALATTVLLFSLLAAVLEGIGLSFMLPIIETATNGGAPPTGGDQVLSAFVVAYDLLGVPFTLGTILVGITLVIGARFGVQFLVAWLLAALETRYVRDLRTRVFDAVLDTRVERLDELGSDELLNAIITQTEYHSAVVGGAVQFAQRLFLGSVYLAVALVLAPQLTVVAVVVMGAVTVLLHRVIQPAYATGEAVAEANARIQETAQSGIMGARDVRLFTMRRRIRDRFADAVGSHADSYVRLQRNSSLLGNAYLFASAVTVFALVYLSIEVYALSVGSFAVFLFSMFRLAPVVSSLNNVAYGLDGELPHLVNTERTITALERDRERVDVDVSAPRRVDRVDFERVTYAYPDGTVAVRELSFSVGRGETVAFVGQSGAGKSTIVSLLTGLSDPTEGTVRADGRDVTSFDVDSWRSRVAVVRQDPYLFNDTLRFNLTVGNPDVGERELERACEVAQITEFLSLLPDGLETVLGDDGVRLSGGQRQRVALARALLTDADVLVLDEATSNLDASLEGAVYDALAASDRDRATVVIAHRLSTITNADRIHVMSRGEVVESGTHGELVTNEGAYAALFVAHVATA